jgi:hypothetical protein
LFNSTLNLIFCRPRSAELLPISSASASQTFQDKSGVDDSDYSFEYGGDPSTRNEELHAKPMSATTLWITKGDTSSSGQV